MHYTVLRIFDYINVIILTYFVVANSVYTILMVLSLYAVTVHSKLAARANYADIAGSPVTPPVSLIVPAFNEQKAIVSTVNCLLNLDYPEREIIVVDDGSTDGTAQCLIEYFRLQQMDLVYRETIKSKRPYAFFHNPSIPELLLVVKENGGKSDALNVGINMARSPYFCTVDADSIIEREALLRLMAPILHSNANVVVSGGVVRIVNGCVVQEGQVTEVKLPKTWIERCQVVEYIRTFLFGRPAWNFLDANFITSGAFCMLNRELVIKVGGFSHDTVTEDIDIIASLHTFLRKQKWDYRMVFTTDPVCWTECPKSMRMLGRQRRRWQLGLIQTVIKHDKMILNPRHRLLGMISMPFHAYVEAIGSVVEALGLIVLPLSFLTGAMPWSLFFMMMVLAVGYGTLLSMGSVLLADATVRRYPKYSDLLTLVLYAMLENFGYRQITTFYRAQGALSFFFGKRKWELVEHEGMEAEA